MSDRTQPEQQAPPVQRLRVRYAKRGRARFASHRDFSRAFERALRRAQIPMAYSSGFSPHPRISYANAAPTGAASEAEYVEIGLCEVRDPDAVRSALADALPLGFDILAVVPAGAGSLADQVSASVWRIEVAGVPLEVSERAVAQLLATPALEVSRMTKSGLRTFDVRSAILELGVEADQTLRFAGLHQVPLVRPDDIVAALRTVCSDFAPSQPPLMTRLAQGVWVDGVLRPPF